MGITNQDPRVAALNSPIATPSTPSSSSSPDRVNNVTRVGRTTRIVCYHQTHYTADGRFVSLQPLIMEQTAVTHVIVGALHIHAYPRPAVFVNNNPYGASLLEPLWEDVRRLQAHGVKVLGMLGGYAGGTFTRLDSANDRSYSSINTAYRADNRIPKNLVVEEQSPTPGTFESFYQPLREMLRSARLDGIDLDVEEHMSLAGAVRLIDRLRDDFGPEFLITMSPVLPALMGRCENLSGFDYVELDKAVGPKIAWYNAQYYSDYGNAATAHEYHVLMQRGRWRPEKIVMGLVTNPANASGWVADTQLRRTLARLVRAYPDFGGVAGWEYFNSISETYGEGRPWTWAKLMREMMDVSASHGPGSIYEEEEADTLSRLFECYRLAKLRLRHWRREFLRHRRQIYPIIAVGGAIVAAVVGLALADRIFYGPVCQRLYRYICNCHVRMPGVEAHQAQGRGLKKWLAVWDVWDWD